jgi:hypothetical protein
MAEKQTNTNQLEKEKSKPEEKPKKVTILDTAEEAILMTREDYRIKGLLVGPSGSGKTQSALTLPGRKLLIDYDGRWETAVGYPDTKIIKLFEPNPESPKSWLSCENLRKLLWRSVRNNAFEYDAIIEAGLTSMLSYAMNWSLTLDPKKGLGDTPAMQHWMPQMFNVESHIKSMKQLPCHYILEAHVEYIDQEEGSDSIYTPKATGKMRTAIPGWFNECYRCSSEKKKAGKVGFFWETTGFGKWDFLKSTLNNLGKYWKDPIEIDFNIEPVGFDKLLGLRFAEEEDGRGDTVGQDSK